jgi:hypothetical protein
MHIRKAIGILLVLFVFAACKKEKDTLALITVVNINGQAVENVKVRLYPEPSIEGANQGELIDEVEQFTDAAGQTVFDFSSYYELGQAGFAVLNIEATKDTLSAEGIIKIDPEVTNSETVIIQ